MKRIILIGSLSITVGFVVGWLARQPASVAGGPEETPAKSGRAAQSPARHTAANPPTAPEEARHMDPFTPGFPSEIGDKVREERSRAARMMIRQKKALHINLVKELGEVLGLSSGQEQELLAFLEGTRDELGSLLGSEYQNDWAVAPRVAALAREDGFDELINGMLDAGRKDAYRQYRSRQLEENAGSQAQASLDRLEADLGLTAEQAPLVYDILVRENTEALGKDLDARALVALWSRSVDVEVDPENLGVTTAIQAQLDQLEEKGVPEDPYAWVRQAATHVDQTIDRRVESLRGVLTEPQLALYRQDLQAKARALGIFERTDSPAAVEGGP